MKSINVMIVAAAAALVLPVGAAAQYPAPAPAPPVPPTAQERTRDQVERIRQQQERVRQQEERRRIAVDQAYPAQQTERVSRTLKIGGTGELEITNLSGNIVIMRGGGNDVQVEAIKTARAGTDEEAREMLQAVQVEFAESSGRGEIRVAYPKMRHEMTLEKKGGRTLVRKNANVSVAFTVKAPEHAEVTVTTLAGDIKASDIRGELSLTSTSGHVWVMNCGNVAARSTSGNVEVSDCKGDSALEVNSISGDVTVRRVKASRVELGTVSGKVTIEEVNAGRIEAQSLSGDVELATPLAKNGRYDLNSHAGNVRVWVVGNVGFEIDANTFSGGVRCDVPLKGGEAGTPDARGRTRALRGVFGDGSASIDVTTFSGNVVVTKKQ